LIKQAQKISKMRKKDRIFEKVLIEVGNMFKMNNNKKIA